MQSTIRKFSLGVAAAVVGIVGSVTAAVAEFPEKPITILAYMKPGGAADVDSRMFATIAERLTGAKFVVKNMTGAGGIVAMKHVLEQPADGYLLMATTKSQVYKIVTAKSDIDVEDFQWLALNQHDPEAIIVNSNDGRELLGRGSCRHRSQGRGRQTADLGRPRGRRPRPCDGDENLGGRRDRPRACQIHPLRGRQGSDDRTARRTRCSLCRQPARHHWPAGPGDCALSRSERLEAVPGRADLRELGVEGLDDEVMWRGFAIKAGMPDDALAFWNDLFAQVAEDPEWVAHVEKSCIDPVLMTNEAFLDVVKPIWPRSRNGQRTRASLSRMTCLVMTTASPAGDGTRRPARPTARKRGHG